MLEFTVLLTESTNVRIFFKLLIHTFSKLVHAIDVFFEGFSFFSEWRKFGDTQDCIGYVVSWKIIVFHFLGKEMIYWHG